ncbi:VOC family protein [Amphibacillus sediminis]|uniref:VOC family protein n=1 Tax=Amphibacillus sediminis TaxID=360185 RepID=UPI000836F9B5|nr:VOC family protein [Amphibacillus sediminis]
MTKPFLFTRVGYAYLPTTDIEGSIAFYTTNLGLKLINKFEDRGSLIAILHYPHQHAIALVLIETKDKAPIVLQRNGDEYPILALNCPDIEYTYTTLKEAGIEVEPLQQLGNGEAKYFYFRDNQGNYLEAAWSQWDPEDDIKEGF